MNDRLEIGGQESPHARLWLAAALALMLALRLTAGSNATEPPDGMMLIPAGVYTSPFQRGTQSLQIPLSAFHIDILPVTNEEFLGFVRANPQWRRSKVQRQWADENYLRHWAGDLDLGVAAPKSPVTCVSWSAARAYAHWKGKRLPKLAEWELAAVGPRRADGRSDPDFKSEILKWYSTPTPAQLPAVGAGRTNGFGIHDLHGLVWEWVADFDAAWATDPMGAGAEQFCGSGAQGARDRTDYAVFLRFGFRSSLRPDYCIHNLGFRCAASCESRPPE